MKGRRQSRGVCALLIIWMLFLGVCFEGLEADSSFLRVCTQQEELPQTSVICTPGITGRLQQAYLSKTDEGQAAGTVIRRSAGRWAHRALREGRGGFDLVSRIDLPHFGGVFGLTDGKAAGTIHSNAVILDYIHQKDGKKA